MGNWQKKYISKVNGVNLKEAGTFGYASDFEIGFLTAWYCFCIVIVVIAIIRWLF